MNHTRWLIPIALVVALAQIGFLASMIAGRAAILRNGTEVTLAVEPVDPRDLLRGDYVTISYNISSLPSSIFVPSEAEDRSLYAVAVRLSRDEDGIWQAVAAQYGDAMAAPAGEGEVDILGTTYTAPGENVANVRMHYGIERFYVPEGEGKPIEEGVRERDFTMRVAVSEGGTAQIKALYENDRLIFAEPLY